MSELRFLASFGYDIVHHFLFQPLEYLTDTRRLRMHSLKNIHIQLHSTWIFPENAFNLLDICISFSASHFIIPPPASLSFLLNISEKFQKAY